MICRISRFGRNSVLAGILSAQWRTTLAHVFTSEGKHLGSENANGCIESCSEQRGEFPYIPFKIKQQQIILCQQYIYRYFLISP